MTDKINLLRCPKCNSLSGYSEYDDSYYCAMCGYKKLKNEQSDKSNVLKEDEWLIFELIDNKPKTKVIQVISKCSEITLGIIKWYPGWRHYCYFPTTELETVYSDRCLSSISKFVTELNSKHKE